jgi:hypothetical protein
MIGDGDLLRMMRAAMPVLTGVIFLSAVSQIFCRTSEAVGLGEKEVITEADRASTNATSNATSSASGAVRIHAAFTIKEIVSNSVPVREYLTRDGTVFAMAWKGRNHPDFATLLGSYYAEFQEISARHDSGPRVRGGRRALKGAHLTIERFGHMGALKGRAIIPSLMPAGVKVSEIR